MPGTSQICSRWDLDLDTQSIGRMDRESGSGAGATPADVRKCHSRQCQGIQASTLAYKRIHVNNNFLYASTRGFPCPVFSIRVVYVASLESQYTVCAKPRLGYRNDFPPE